MMCVMPTCPVGPCCPCFKKPKPPTQLEQCNMRYVQPARPKSYMPIRSYCRPVAQVESGTIYRQSYLPQCGEKVNPFLPNPQLCIPKSIFADETTQQHDYRCWPCKRTPPIVPANRHMLGEGPMQCLTTNRHDYTQKMVPRALSLRRPGNLKPSDEPIDNLTTMNMSYQYPDPCAVDPSLSYRPTRTYRPPEVPVEDSTIQKLSYPQWPIGPKEDMPWARKAPFCCPSLPMEKSTTYSKSYPLACGDRRKAIIRASQDNILGGTLVFYADTVQKKSYLPHCVGERPQPFRPKPFLQTCPGKFADETTQLHDYRPWNPAPAKPIVPANRHLLGEGPMACLTTQRHDYTCKSVPKPLSLKRPNNLGPSDQPIENLTTMNMSYQPPDACAIDKVLSYRPIKSYRGPEVPFEDATIQKLSFPQWPVGPREKFQWGDKSYKPSCQAFEGDTTYNNSYLLPGKFERECQPVMPVIPVIPVVPCVACCPCPC